MESEKCLAVKDQGISECVFTDNTSTLQNTKKTQRLASSDGKQ